MNLGVHEHDDPLRHHGGAEGVVPADDIDGVSTYPGASWSTPGLTGAGKVAP